MHWKNTYVRINLLKRKYKDGIWMISESGDLEMVKYLEAAECICLAISVCNLIAVSFAMKNRNLLIK